MNLKPYIESGILELYVLNLLSADEQMGVQRMLKVYPSLITEIKSIEKALEDYALANAVNPNPKLAQVIFREIKNSQNPKALKVDNLSLINEKSDFLQWLALSNRFDPQPMVDGLFTKLLHHDEQVTQLLIVSETNIQEEIHEAEHESFLILKGECSCIVNGVARHMGPGDFMAIPLYEPHDVKLLSKQVTAILQRVKVS
ncbi:MAG: cupin domain-containing protein [Pedobacter sp.]|nr:MAG: cupin domain-containing protein [Pedobacter sp.]